MFLGLCFSKKKELLRLVITIFGKEVFLGDSINSDLLKALKSPKPVLLMILFLIFGKAGGCSGGQVWETKFFLEDNKLSQI